MTDFPKQYKETFLLTCNKYELPMHNKAIFLYTLASKLEKNPQNKELKDLLMTSICDNGFLLSHFSSDNDTSNPEASYNYIQKRKTKLLYALKNEYKLVDAWHRILSHPKFQILETTHFEENDCHQSEATYLTYLFRDVFEITEKESTELYYNIHNYVVMTKSSSYLRSIAPLFFTQLMKRHTKRLASNPTLIVTPESLWKYETYNITHDNGKNYKSIDLYFYTFRMLCKYYKKDESVNIELCRYGFQQCSNTMEWISFMEHELINKGLTKLTRIYNNLGITYWEPNEPTEYGIYSSYGIKTKKADIYFNKHMETYWSIEDYLTDYLSNHVEYIIICMQNMYLDATSLQKCVADIYQNALLDEKYPKEIPMHYRLSHVYEHLTNTLDLTILEKVRRVLL